MTAVRAVRAAGAVGAAVRILVDMDGVLADFGAGFDVAWQAAYPGEVWLPSADLLTFHVADSYPAHLRDAVRALCRVPGFFRGLPPVAGAVAGFLALAAAGHDVWICTAPLTAYEHCVLEKHQWVEEHLGREWVSRVVMTRDKTLVTGDVLLDDRPEVTGVAAPTWTHVLHDWPYNAHVDLPRLRWDTAGTVLASLDVPQACANRSSTASATRRKPTRS